MEFAWNLQKNLMSDVKGLEKEQNREGKISNEDIKLTMTHLNHDLIQTDLNLYQRVKKRVEEVRSNSRIQKNSIVDCSNIITVPKEQALIWGKEKTEEYFKAVCEIFKEQFGAENVVSAMIHLDETSPHMHLHFVPVSEEGKLQARKVTTREKIKLIHDIAPQKLQERGFDVTRGMGVTEKSLEIHKFKASKLKENIKALETKFKALEGDLKGLEDVKGSIGQLDKIEGKKSPLGAKISIREVDYNLLMDSAKAYIKTLAEIDKLQRELERIENKSVGLGDENKNLKNEIKSLKVENKKLQHKLDDVVKKGWTLRSAVDEHPDSELILEKARMKRDAPKLKQTTSKHQLKCWDVER